MHLLGRDRNQRRLYSGAVGMTSSENPASAKAELRVGTRSEPVVFFLADEPDIDAVRGLDPDRQPEQFRTGERSWIAQTFLRLRAAGLPVDLSDRPPQRGLVVFHAKHKHALAQVASGEPKLVFVGVRADNSSPLLADFEVLQNGRFEDGRTRFRMPHWPQAGLVPRDAVRGARVETVGYMGLEENLHPAFLDERWSQELAKLGVEWRPNIPRSTSSNRAGPVNWESYRDLDVMLAVRPGRRELEFAKPATKLVNAWRAGVPALIGPEYACREIRRDPRDYIEVRGPADALAAVRRLRDDHELYLEMVRNGARWAGEFSFESITRQWAKLLFETIPARIAEGHLCWTRNLPIPIRVHARRAGRLFRRERTR